MKYTFDWKKYADTARQTVAEGCVLLRNENNTLPIKLNETVSVFGRIQFDYYKSGTGSGGMVNTPYVVSILDALKEDSNVQLNEELLQQYTEWLKDHPFDPGQGWANEPWCQEEMDVTESLAKEAAVKSDMALVIIGRSSGEDRDSSVAKGSYLLNDKEEEMLKNVCSAFDRVAVVLNVGNIIDMSFVEKYKPQAVLYVWQGGMEGGHGVADVLIGRQSPSGKLTDTIAYDIKDYPSTANFGDENQNIYKEDIYIGYRYFETAAQNKVHYPFGFGLSYTEFSYEVTEFSTNKENISVSVQVKNIGNTNGKEVIQLYYNPPQGALSKPVRNLIRFAKTKELQPGEYQTLFLVFPISEMASFDDTGVTGYFNCFVLEKGDYQIFAGTSVRDIKLAGSYTHTEDCVVEQVNEACVPVNGFNRMKLVVNPDGSVIQTEESVPAGTNNISQNVIDNRPTQDVFTGNKGYTFREVMEGKVSDYDYLSQMTDEELIYMSRGEGMCPPHVTPGIAGSFGGVTGELRAYGMPVAGCADGPSGIRMDCGTKAFSLPCGTLAACTFNEELIEELYQWEGMELRKNKIDALLAPGMNIHRNPLNGRNFEYFSEDPYLTGKMACCMLKGMSAYGAKGTVKHFAANNQEHRRSFTESVVSKRALREIYLKCFEMAVKEGKTDCVMTTYGPLNGIWTAGNYELNTVILRQDWGFKGLVMTDWWAKVNDENQTEPTKTQTTSMIRSQNDVYMVCGDSKDNANGDDSLEGLKEGRITRGELMRNAMNILSVLKTSIAADRMMNGEDEVTELNRPKTSEREKIYLKGMTIKKENILDLTGLDTSAGSTNQFPLHTPDKGFYEMSITLKSDLSELAQMNISIFTNNTLWNTITLNGTNGKWITKTAMFQAAVAVDTYLDLYFAQSGIDIGEIKVTKKYTVEEYMAIMENNE